MFTNVRKDRRNERQTDSGSNSVRVRTHSGCRLGTVGDSIITGDAARPSGLFQVVLVPGTWGTRVLVLQWLFGLF